MKKIKLLTAGALALNSALAQATTYVYDVSATSSTGYSISASMLFTTDNAIAAPAGACLSPSYCGNIIGDGWLGVSMKDIYSFNVTIMGDPLAAPTLSPTSLTAYQIPPSNDYSSGLPTPNVTTYTADLWVNPLSNRVIFRGDGFGFGNTDDVIKFGHHYYPVDQISWANQSQYSSELTMVAAVPEPHEWAMMLAGLMVIVPIARRAKRSSDLKSKWFQASAPAA